MAKAVPELSREVRASRRWTTRQAAAVVAALRSSGLGVRAFARQVGLDPQRVERWRRKLEPAASFVEIAPLGALQPVPHSRSEFEITVRNGRVVGLGRGFDGEELRRLLAIVEEPC